MGILKSTQKGHSTSGPKASKLAPNARGKFSCLNISSTLNQSVCVRLVGAWPCRSCDLITHGQKPRENDNLPSSFCASGWVQKAGSPLSCTAHVLLVLDPAGLFQGLLDHNGPYRALKPAKFETPFLGLSSLQMASKLRWNCVRGPLWPSSDFFPLVLQSECI